MWIMSHWSNNAYVCADNTYETINKAMFVEKCVISFFFIIIITVVYFPVRNMSQMKVWCHVQVLGTKVLSGTLRWFVLILCLICYTRKIVSIRSSLGAKNADMLFQNFHLILQLLSRSPKSGFEAHDSWLIKFSLHFLCINFLNIFFAYNSAISRRHLSLKWLRILEKFYAFLFTLLEE